MCGRGVSQILLLLQYAYVRGAYRETIETATRITEMERESTQEHGWPAPPAGEGKLTRKAMRYESRKVGEPGSLTLDLHSRCPPASSSPLRLCGSSRAAMESVEAPVPTVEAQPVGSALVPFVVAPEARAVRVAYRLLLSSL